MKSYSTEKIRNLALVGHSASGKTSVCEALLYKTGNLKRLGKVEDGNTVTDFDKEEISHELTVRMTVILLKQKSLAFINWDVPVPALHATSAR